MDTIKEFKPRKNNGIWGCRARSFVAYVSKNPSKNGKPYLIDGFAGSDPRGNVREEDTLEAAKENAKSLLKSMIHTSKMRRLF